jgi:hypothetical protein
MKRHIIQKQVVELSLYEMEKFHPVADAFNNIIQQTVLPRLSNQFDKLSDEHTVITADQLEIDLGIISDWERQKDFLGDRLVELIVQKISALIDERKNHKNFSEARVFVPVPIRQWVAWKQYLETGSLPWFGRAGSQYEWETVLTETLDFNSVSHSYIKEIIREVVSNQQARKRLLLVFSRSFIDVIIKATGRATEDRLWLIRFAQWLEVEMKISGGAFEKLSREVLLTYIYNNDPGISFIALLENLICLYPNQNWVTIVKTIKKSLTINESLSGTGLQKMMQYFIDVLLSPVSENEFRKTIREIPETFAIEPYFSSRAFQIINDQKLPGNEYRSIQAEAIGQGDIDASTVQDYKRNDIALIPAKEASIENESLYVPYAGLVITAAFLPMFFEAVGLIKDGTFTSFESQIKAVRLTGFLGSGQIDTPDWELAVPKILCGLDSSVAISMDEVPDKESLLEAESLLKALIKHWNALGYCSTDGLREGFLERNGKLTDQPENWLLQVEAKTIDILLDKISWSFSTIKLPWMQKMLITEWNI